MMWVCDRCKKEYSDSKGARMCCLVTITKKEKKK